MSHVPPASDPAVIREATAADLPRLLELLHQLSQLGEVPEAVVAAPSAAHQQALSAMRGDPRNRCFVLEIGGRVEGTFTLYILPNLSHGARPAAIVENVVVDAAQRGSGHGRRLMAHAERVARESGCYKVALTSNRRRTAAHHFYERIGYVPSHVGFSKYEREEGTGSGEPA